MGEIGPSIPGQVRSKPNFGPYWSTFLPEMCRLRAKILAEFGRLRANVGRNWPNSYQSWPILRRIRLEFAELGPTSVDVGPTLAVEQSWPYLGKNGSAVLEVALPSFRNADWPRWRRACRIDRCLADSGAARRGSPGGIGRRGYSRRAAAARVAVASHNLGVGGVPATWQPSARGNRALSSEQDCALKRHRIGTVAGASPGGRT